MAVVITIAVDIYPECLTCQLAHMQMAKLDPFVGAPAFAARKPLDIRECYERVALDLGFNASMADLKEYVHLHGGHRLSDIPEAAFRGELDV